MRTREAGRPIVCLLRLETCADANARGWTRPVHSTDLPTVSHRVRKIGPTRKANSMEADLEDWIRQGG